MERIEYGDLCLDEGAWRVYRRGEHVRLTRTEFRLLKALLAKPERVQTRDELAMALWGEGPHGNLESHVRNLRAKLERHGPRIIQTVHGAGFVLRILTVAGAKVAFAAQNPRFLPDLSTLR